MPKIQAIRLMVQQFRRSKVYIGFQFSQLSLCFATIIYTCLNFQKGPDPIITTLQLCLLFVLIFDIAIRCCSELKLRKFMGKQQNIVDVILCFIFTALIIVQGAMTQGEGMEHFRAASTTILLSFIEVKILIQIGKNICNIYDLKNMAIQSSNHHTNNLVDVKKPMIYQYDNKENQKSKYFQFNEENHGQVEMKQKGANQNNEIEADNRVKRGEINKQRYEQFHDEIDGGL